MALARRRGAGLGMLVTSLMGFSLSPLLAQEPSAKPDFAHYRPSLAATRIEPSEAPKIDGDVSDAVWNKAPSIEDFYQVEPNTGERPTERTVAHVLYDENAIYVSFYCYDDDPPGIRSGAKARDGTVSNGDIVRIYLDPGMTRRDGYAFEINPLGGRLDAIIQNNNDYLPNWDTLWEAKVHRVADGWTVEVAIPFRSISYDASRTDWGFDLYRLIRRKNERIRWTSINPAIPSVDISQSGTITGIDGLRRGIGLDIQGYASLRYKHEWEPPREDDLKLVESANAYYRITPELTGTVTFNPDFSDTPLDQRRVNTTRFALFLPETRDFFLQDAAVFEFGGQAFVNDPNGLPFFSRNVGLVNGVPVPLIAGGKLSGKYESIGIGAFSTLTADSGPIDGQVLSVTRITVPVLGESRAGIIVTNGDPTGATTNTLAGGDFQYRNSHAFGDKILQADLSYQESFSNVFGDDHEIGVGVTFPNEPWGGRFRFKEIGDNFAPALGFVNRIGIRSYHTEVERRTRYDGILRWIELGAADNLVTGLDNNHQSRDSLVWIGTMTNRGDLGFFNIHQNYESVPVSFSFGGNAIVSPGEYHYTTIEPYIETSYARKLQFTADAFCCEFYDGNLFFGDFTLTYRPNETLEIIPRYTVAFIDLPSGSVDIQAALFDVNVYFTPDMQIKTEAQYDNQSKNLTFSARYRWEFRPGSELFAALGEDAMITHDIRHPHYASQTTQASVRVGHTLRF